ncbi:MAG TPA: glutamate 5-kinase [Jiangellaceae bacterium]|nr:glutamate 5-kinase [Jiangellaceae bacterium]
MTMQSGKPVAASKDRSAFASGRRVVVKVGSSSLTTAAGGLDGSRLTTLADELAKARLRGQEVILVSSGAIAAGLAPLNLPRRPRQLALQQAAAAVGQGLLVARYTEAFARHGLDVGQVLLTVDDMTRRTHYRNAYSTLHKLLDLGVVPVVNENDTVATHEIRFGDNDRLAALVAQLVHADALILLSDVDGLYDGDPALQHTRRVSEVRDLSELDGLRIGGTGRAGLGSGGMRTKVEAARIATGSGIDVVLASAREIAAVLAGEPVGTRFLPRARGRRSRRLLWLEHATDAQGRLRLDAGAVRAVVEHGKSLLPAGITGVEGRFVAGDPVDLVDDRGRAVARGLVNYDASELPALLGRSTRELGRELGPEYEREVVHRDDMVVLRH